MIYPKELPENGELVIIKIKKIMPFGVHCDLIEYNAEAYLPIKEVAPGWIKNIHEFVKEGQQRVAKVIFVDKEKKAIDVSLKKVSKKEEKDKIGEYNLELRSKKLFEQALKESKKEADAEKIKNKLAKSFQNYSDVIEAIVEGREIGEIDPEFKEAFIEIVKKNVKPKRYKVGYIAEITVFDTENGIDIIKKALTKVQNEGVNVIYMGAPHYKLTAEDIDYHSAEAKIKKAEEILRKEIPSGIISIQKEKNE
ncbi:MAG: S1 RNA-binding domain-containing protein [Candidatus Micrarchaeia archaeon]|jgi:translation initiation factor 2 subunit 1